MAFEDPQIKTKELPVDFSHEQINSAFNPLQPNDNALAAAGQYAQIAQKWREGVAVFADRMRRASSAAWDGAAAEKSRTAIANYTQRATELTPELEALASRVHETAQAITSTKDALPEVVQKFSWTSPSTWDNAFDGDEREDAEEKAREVMGNNYVTPFGAADGIVPKLSTPVSPTNPLYSTVDDGTGGNNDDNNNGSTGGGTDNGDDSPTTDPAATETPTDEQEPTTDETPTTDESADDSTDDGDHSDDDTSPSSATPTDTTPAATTPTSGTPSTGAPGGGTGGGTGGGGGGSGAPGTGLMAPGAGRSVAGAPSPGTPAAAAA
ncbi:hypothetical protein, partial [Nocardia neocaledoniensis]|uniref:hypothetical protein n=1 Tax=Nocardia neocaledoniensis TaxID=236511 RepID=UPI002454697C